ncbi:MAG: nucleotidyltransferase [Thermodesulfobacteriota bacterium]
MELQKEIVRVCAALNREKVKYIVVGRCAVILHGYRRTTYDIDLLVDPSSENIRRLKKVFREVFQSDEVSEIRDVDIEQYAVVRFVPESEEIVIDLIGKIGKVNFETPMKDIEEVELEGVKIPVCGLSALIETKKRVRSKDKEDLLFLLGKREYLKK